MSSPTVVVVAWRAGARAAACLERLATAAPGCPCVVVDNESRPGELDRMLAGRARVKGIELADNLGFAGGANLGIERAFADGASHVVLLNDDVLVEPGCIEALVEAAGEGDVASPVIDAPGVEAFSGGAIDARGFGFHRAGSLEFLTGAAICIPGAVWQRVGPLDDRLFLYYEDVEWCLRARAAGAALLVVATARASHLAGASTGGGSGPTWAYYSTRNRLWLLEQRFGRARARREALNTAGRAAARLVAGPRSVARAKLLGVRDWRARRLGRGPYPA
jgi:GT2 family glycosyltransferase